MSFIEYVKMTIDNQTNVTKGSGMACIFGNDDSLIAGEMLSNYIDACCDAPLQTVSDSRVPGWIDSNVDCIILSCTGDSRWSNSIYDKLRQRGCRIFYIGVDGWLMQRCRMDGTTFLEIPSDLPINDTVGATLGLLCGLVQDLDICNARDHLESLLSDLSDSSFDDEREIAKNLRNRIPSFYSQSSISACSKYWKRAFNKATGMPAFHGELPEFDHNELVGWADPNNHAKDLFVITFEGGGSELTTDLSRLMRDVLNLNGRKNLILNVKGDDPMEENIKGIMLGERVMSMMDSGETI